ncbi:MAG TPA: HD domain-containing protein [Firmicutes bacterium]|nr:HD domain-containing protein [Bacillota bacterium]
MSWRRMSFSLALYAAWAVLAWVLYPRLSHQAPVQSWWLPVHTTLTAVIVMLCSAAAFNLFLWEDYVPTFARWLAPALFAAGFLEFQHAVSLPPSGTPALYSREANLWFWAAARWLTGIAFFLGALTLLFAHRPKQPPPRRYQTAALAGLGLLLFWLVHLQRSLPPLRTPGPLPSPAEFWNVLVPTAFTAAASLLIASREEVLHQPEIPNFVLGLDLLVLSQILLLFSASTFDWYSMLAHPLKLGAYALLFKVLVASTVVRPYRQLKQSMAVCLDSLTEAIDAHDTYTRGHSARVQRYAELIGAALRLPPGQQKRLSIAARLHDVGKLNIPDQVLSKPGPLDESEWVLVRQHPLRSARIVEPLCDREVHQAVLEHHERFDGAGYPAGKKGEEIDLLARIIAVADTFDALTSDRPYRERCDPARALHIIQDAAGTQLDPECVAAFCRVFDRVLARMETGETGGDAAKLVASTRS